MDPFETSITVRFGDVDYAGIVYYPRVVHYLHVAFEDLFAERAGRPYAEILKESGVGFPTVHAEVDFARPLEFGDVVRIGIDTVRIGRASVTLRYRLRKGEQEDIAAEARITTACVDMESFEPRPIPEDLRTFFTGLTAG